MTIRTFIPHFLPYTLAITIILGVLGPLEANGAQKPPNILWIIAEDMGPELSCRGTPEVATPVIDGLASNGMRFENAFTVTPVCSTSRSSFMTGMYAMSIDAHNHRSHRDGTNLLPQGVRVLTDWLRPHGYWTANIRAFPAAEPGRDLGPLRGIRGTGKTDWNFTYFCQDTARKSPVDPDEQSEATGRRAGQNAAFDSQNWDDLKSHQPFYAQINFAETHRGTAWNVAHQQIEHPADPAEVEIPPYYPDHPITRAVWAQYLNAVMAVDLKVGYVLDLLKRDGLDGNTVIVFMSDHGRAMPRGKQWPYDSGLKIPLIIYWPENNPELPEPTGYLRGETSDQLVSSIDVTATTLDVAKVDKPEKMQGRILYGDHAEPARKIVFGGRDRGDESVFHIRTARDRRFRYIRNKYPERPFLQRNLYKETSYPIIGLLRHLHDKGTLKGLPAKLMAASRPREELYDIQSDPWETKNLANDPMFSDEKSRLAKALDAWMTKIEDCGRHPESEDVVSRWRSKMDRHYEKKLASRGENWFRGHPALGPYGEEAPPKLPLKFSDDFEQGIGNWEILDPKTWRTSTKEGNTTLEITARGSEYKPPFRSPGHVALIKDMVVGDFDFTFRVRSTKDTGNHRDCCVFFAYEDNQHFYYAHLGAKPDPHSGQIMIVKEAPRLALTKNERLTPWDDQWHQVKVVGRVAEGTIQVYFDDMNTPHMSVKDTAFGKGRIGIGSFDDLNEFDNVRLYAR